MAIEKPSHASAVLLPLALLMTVLGWWQVERMKEKQSLIDAFEGGETTTLERAIANGLRFARVSETGRFDTRRHILLDNKVLNGVAGVHVLTPFQTFSGLTVLVNRGWKPLQPDRRTLPDVWTPSVPVAIRGTLAPLPEYGPQPGAADELSSDDWPQLVTYLDISAAAEALQSDLASWIVWLDPEDPAGFKGRDWSPATVKPERHQAYAVQWFALAGTALLIWGVLLWRHASRRRNGGAGS